MTRPHAVIVAHGSPSDPDTLDRSVKALAARVARLAPGWRIEGATLAKPGSLSAAVGGSAADGPLAIYPFFMSDGWFVETELRRRVAGATPRPAAFLPPFGLDPALPALCIRVATERLEQQGVPPGAASLVLAAHGSAKNGAPAAAARHIECLIEEIGGFGEVRLGFVEQPPAISQAADGLQDRPAICLPLFATRAGHVNGDVPRQLAMAGFRGAVLPPIGEAEGAAFLIARAL